MKTLISILFGIFCIYSHAQENKVKSFELFKDEAGRPEYNHDGSMIAFHAKGDDGYYDIYTMNADGSNEKCLTCNHSNLPNKHIGQPSWHPSENWIIFQAEKSEHILGGIGALAAPGIGYHNDVYVLHVKTGTVTQLTNLKTKKYIGDKTPSCAILQPHFSNNGQFVSWSERYKDGGDWGGWVVKSARFNTENNTASLSDVKRYTPGINKGYYESNDFLNGDTTLLICGNLEKGQTELGIDIYTLHLKDSSTTRLTHSIDFFDECPHPNPSNTKICYLSTQGFPHKDNKRWWAWGKGEFWLMNMDGTSQQQITFFNTPDHEHYSGYRTIPAYIAWAPDNKTILLAVAVEYKKRKLKDQIFKITLE